MTTDAINTTGSQVQIYDELIVNLGPTDGSAPGETQTFDDVYCTRVVQSAGGSRMDYAELVYGLYDHLQDRDQPSGFSRRVHVRMPDGTKTLLADGDYVSESAGVQQNGEALTARVQQRQYFFGNPLKHYDVHSPLSDLNAEIEDDIVFNPVVDDKTVFNRSDQARPGAGNSGYLWTHPELADTSTGETYQEQTREEWTLRQAVHSVCELLNPLESFIKRPITVDLDKLDDAPLRAVAIPLGTYLPQALDLLLIPLGFNWYVDYTESTPWIEFFKIGEGEEKTLFMQRVGESLDLEWSNLNQFQISNSIGDSFNDVLAMGEFEEAEFTFPLFPGWNATYDETSLDDLDKSSTEYTGKETAWRLWIANEAGDIDPAVDRLGQTPTVPDLRDVFTKYIPHRRTIGEPLTFLSGTQDDDDDNEKQRRPIVVEYSVDGGTTWNPLPDEWSVKLCPNQIGILFDNKKPPEELYTAADEARVRITGTIFGDSRIQYHATKQAWAVNGRTVQQVVKRPEKFQHRWRQETGDYASVLTGPHDEKDDSTDIQSFAEKLRDQNHYAEVDCEFSLPGWHLEYKIGDLISKIEGREINLDGAPSNAPDYRFPQIVERRFEMTSKGPSTVLIVDRGVQPV